jgi:hypothetical protein
MKLISNIIESVQLFFSWNIRSDSNSTDAISPVLCCFYKRPCKACVKINSLLQKICYLENMALGVAIRPDLQFTEFPRMSEKCDKFVISLIAREGGMSVCVHREDVWGRWGIAPFIIWLGSSWRCDVSFTSRPLYLLSRNLWLWKQTNKMHYIDQFIISSRPYMFRAMFSPMIRSTWLYLQYLVVFTQVGVGTSQQQLG